MTVSHDISWPAYGLLCIKHSAMSLCIVCIWRKGLAAARVTLELNRGGTVPSTAGQISGPQPVLLSDRSSSDLWRVLSFNSLLIVILQTLIGFCPTLALNVICSYWFQDLLLATSLLVKRPHVMSIMQKRHIAVLKYILKFSHQNELLMLNYSSVVRWISIFANIPHFLKNMWVDLCADVTSTMLTCCF